MKVPFFSANRIHRRIHKDLMNAMETCLDKGVFSGGEDILQFEKDFSKYTGSQNFIACSNGTDALEIIFRSLNLQPGDEIIVPEFSCEASVEPLYLMGVKPVFANVDRNTMCINSDSVLTLITKKTKAVLAVHIFGNPAPVESLMKIAEDWGLKLIEDCSQAHGLRINDVHVGNFGIAGAFSFYPTKNLGALGEAGGITTNDTELANTLMKYINHGQRNKNSHEFPGRNARMDTMQAILLSVKLPYLDVWNKERKKIANIYKRELTDKVEYLSSNAGVNHIFAIRSDNSTKLKQYLSNAGIETSEHYPYGLDLFENKNGPEFTDLFSLPIYPGLSLKDQKYVIDQFNSFF